MKRRYPDRSNSSPPRYLSLRIDQYIARDSFGKEFFSASPSTKHRLSLLTQCPLKFFFYFQTYLHVCLIINAQKFILDTFEDTLREFD